VATPTSALLTEAELGAWRSFLRAHAQITRALEADLVAAEAACPHGLPVADLIRQADRRLS